MSGPVNPITWTANYIPQATDFNTQIRDAFNFLLAPPVLRVWQSASQSIPNGTTPTALLLDTVIVDTYSGWQAANHRYLAPVDGWYHVSGLVLPASGSIYPVACYAEVSGTWFDETAGRASTVACGLGFCDEIYLRGGVDWITIGAAQQSGSSQTFPAGTVNNGTILEIAWVSE